MKIRLLISSSVSVASALTRPFSRAFFSTRSGLMPAPSSRDFDDDAAAAMLGGQADGALLGLAGGDALVRRLDAVIHRVADDMGERIAQPLDDRTVDFGGLAAHFEPDFLARLGRQFAHQPRHALEHRANRLGADRHHPVLEFARVMDDFVERLQQPATDVFGKLLHDLPEHRLRDDEFADHVDDAVDLLEFDARGGCGRPWQDLSAALAALRQLGRACLLGRLGASGATDAGFATRADTALSQREPPQPLLLA